MVGHAGSTALGRSCFGQIEVKEEDEARIHCCAAAIVKRPCCCCWLSLLLAIAASIAGGGVMISVNQGKATGPMRGTEGGLTYPITATIAKQMDALYLSDKQSVAAYETWRRSRWSGRGMKEQSRPDELAAQEGLSALDAVVRLLPESAGGATARELLRALSVDGTHESESAHRALQSSAGPPLQTDLLLSAMFIFNSRSSSGSVFTDEVRP
jgi:hypothetical protein